MSLPTDQRFILFVIILAGVFALATCVLSIVVALMYKQAKSQIMDYSSRLTSKEIDLKNYSLKYEEVAKELVALKQNATKYESELARRDVTIAELQTVVEGYETRISDLSVKLKKTKAELKSAQKVEPKAVVEASSTASETTAKKTDIEKKTTAKKPAAKKVTKK